MKYANSQSVPDETAFDQSTIEALHHSQHNEYQKPNTLYIIPTVKRPFFPGMAAPVFIEPGPFYEALKIVAKTTHKCLGIVLTKSEIDTSHQITLDDIHSVGVVARILRIIPTEQGGAQVVFNMEGRIRIEKPASNRHKLLMAQVSYHIDEVVLSKALKAYALSI